MVVWVLGRGGQIQEDVMRRGGGGRGEVMGRRRGRVGGGGGGGGGRGGKTRSHAACIASIPTVRAHSDAQD